jgi:hypothetical protein
MNGVVFHTSAMMISTIADACPVSGALPSASMLAR